MTDLVNWDAVEAKVQADEKAPATKPVMESGQVNWDSLEARVAEPTIAPTGETSYSTNTIYNEYLSPALQDLGRHFAKGEQEIPRSLELHEALQGKKDVQQVLAKYKQKGLEQADLTPFGSILGPVVEGLPQMSYGLKAGLATAAGFGVLGAPAGPGGVATGATFGLGTGMYFANSTTAAGHLYGELVDQGVPENVAEEVAVFGGAALGGIMTTGWNILGKAGQEAFVNYLKGEGKVLFKDAVKSYAGHIGTQAALGGASKLTEQLSGTIAKAVGNHKLPSPAEFVKGFMDLWSATAGGAVAGAVLTPAVSGTGALLGRGLKAMFNFRANPNARTRAEVVDAILHPNEPETLEQRIQRDTSQIEAIATPNAATRKREKEAKHQEKKTELKTELRVQAKRIENADKQIYALEGQVEATIEDFDYYIAQQEQLAQQAKDAQDPKAGEKIDALEQERKQAQSDLKGAKEDLEKATTKKTRTSVQKRVGKLEGRIEQINNEIKDLDRPYETEKIHNRRRIDLEKQRAAAVAALKQRITLAREDKTAAVETHKEVNAEYKDIESADRAKAKEKLTAALEASAPVEENGVLKSAVRGENIQRILDKYKAFLKDSEARQKAEDDFYRALASVDGPTEEQRIAFEVAKDIPADMKKASSEEITSLARKIEALTQRGKENKAAYVAELHAERQALIDEANAMVDGNDPANVDHPHADKRNARTPISVIGDVGRQYGAPAYTWLGKIVDVAMQDTPPAQRQEIKNKLSWAEPLKASIRAKRAWADAYFAKMKEKTGRSGAAVLFDIAKASATKKTIHYRNAENKPDSATMSVMEMAHLWLMLKDESLKTGLTEGNKYTLDGPGSTLEAVEQALPQSIKDIALATQEFLGPNEFGAYYATGYEKHTGLPLKLNNNHSGPASRVAHEGETNTAQFALELNSYSAAPGSLKTLGSAISRTDSALPLKSKNLFSNTMNHIGNVTNWVEKYEHSETVGAVLADKGFKARVNVKYPGLLPQIEGHNADIMYGVQDRTQQGAWIVNHVASGIAVDAFGFNPGQTLKQASGVVNGLLEIPTPHYLIGLTKFWADPIKNTNVLLQSPTIRARYSGFESTAAGIEGNSGSLGLATRGMRETSLIPMKGGDAIASMQVGYAMYNWKISTKNPATGKPHTHAEALAAAEEIIENTQASGRVDNLGIQSRKIWLKPFTIMMQPTFRMWEYETTAYRDAINHGGTENWTKAIKTSLVLGASNFAFKMAAAGYTQMLANAGLAKQEDADKQYWRAYRGLLLREDMPIVGGLVDAALLDAQKKYQEENGVTPGPFGMGQEPTTERPYLDHLLSTTLGDTIDKTVKFHQKLEKKIEDGEITKAEAAEIMADFAQSAYNRVILQLPMSSPAKMVKDANAEDDETVFEIPDREDGE